MSEQATPQAVERHRATGALAIQADQEFWTDQQRAALAQIGLAEASNGDLAVFLTYAQRTGLDPWTRQLYMIGRWDGREQRNKYTIQASIDGLRIVAQRTGDYAGQVGPEWCGPDGAWRDVWLHEQPPAAARVGVLRRGWTQPQYAVAVFREYAGTTKEGGLTKMWKEKPALMIAKCAEALALRKAFPQDLSGIYTGDEMSRADVVTSTAGEARVQRLTADQLAAERAQQPARPQPGPDDVRAALLVVRSREEMRAVMAELQLYAEGKGWRTDVLQGMQVADEQGQPCSAWDLLRSRGASLPETTPAEPPQPTGPELITQAQLTAVNAAVAAMGITDRDQRLAVLSDWTADQRELASSTEMTKAEAHRMLDELHRRAQPDTVDAELVEDDTAATEPGAGAERRQEAPPADPARRHPAMAAAMPHVRATAARQQEQAETARRAAESAAYPPPL